MLILSGQQITTQAVLSLSTVYLASNFCCKSKEMYTRYTNIFVTCFCLAWGHQTTINILYFFKYSCTNIFHRRSLYTFYQNQCWLIIRKVHRHSPKDHFIRDTRHHSLKIAWKLVISKVIPISMGQGVNGDYTNTQRSMTMYMFYVIYNAEIPQ